MENINIYKISHHYSSEAQSKVISSRMSFTEIWNRIVLLQLTCNDIDSSHAISEANAATFLIKYCDAMAYDPNFFYDKAQVVEIDLYLNLERGLLDKNGNPVKWDSEAEFDQIFKEHIELYQFNYLGMLSFILDLIIRDHRLFAGEVGNEESFTMDNPTWQTLFNEGIYTKELVLSWLNVSVDKDDYKQPNPADFAKPNDVTFNLGDFYFVMSRIFADDDEFYMFCKYLMNDLEVRYHLASIMAQVSVILRCNQQDRRYWLLSDIFCENPWRGQKLIFGILQSPSKTIKDLIADIDYWATVPSADELNKLVKEADNEL